MFRAMRFLPFCLVRGALGPVVAVGAIVAAILYAVSKNPGTVAAKV